MSNESDHDEITGEILAPSTMEASIGAEINQQVMTARRFPRRTDKVIAAEIMSRATLNEEIASECTYSKPVGDKIATGPSARFAEIVFASFGNLRVAARFVRIDKDDPDRQAVVVEAVCHDMQSNNARVVPTRRSIMTSSKGGKRAFAFSPDMINTTMAAAASIAAREAILKVAPKSVWIEGYQRVIAVVRGDEKTLGERRRNAIALFGKHGVKPADLFAALNVPDENGIGLDLMPTLIGMYTALKEGESVESVLGRAREETGATHKTVANPLADKPVTQADSATSQLVAQHPQNAQTQAIQSVSVQTVAETQQNRSDPASNDAAKSDRAQNAPAGASEGPSGDPPPDKGAATANAQTPAARDGASYLAEGLVITENATNAAALRNWWRGQRKEREAAGMSEAQLRQLTDAYNAKFVALSGE